MIANTLGALTEYQVMNRPFTWLLLFSSHNDNMRYELLAHFSDKEIEA